MSVLIRKNQASLSTEEKQEFIAALLRLKNGTASQMGLPSRYDDYIYMHAASMPATGKGWAHGGPAFLPWHRAFLRRFEMDLGVPLPYWDWTTDGSSENEHWPFVSTFLGGDGRAEDGKVMDGPFAYDSGNWSINVQPPGSPLPEFLTRNIGSDTSAPFPPSKTEVDDALGEIPYDESPWGRQSAPSFRDRLEGFHGLGSLHNRVHNFISGHMRNVYISPSDPVFYLHHANIDRLWAEWQKRHPLQPYLPGDLAPKSLLGHRLNDPMQPWGEPITVASTLKYWEAYQYDNVEIPPNDPVGSVELPVPMRPFSIPAWDKENVPKPVAGHHDHSFDASAEDLARFGRGGIPHDH